jgi:hypothetical protein
VSVNEIGERTRWVDGCGWEVGSGRDGDVSRVIPGGISRRIGIGNAAAESGMSRFEIQIFGRTHMEMSPGGVSPLMRRRQASWVS